MTTYFISYELNDAFSQDDFFSKMESLGEIKKFSKNAYFLVSDHTAKEIRDTLVPAMDSSERIMVLKSASPAAWKNSMTDNKWILENVSNKSS